MAQRLPARAVSRALVQALWTCDQPNAITLDDGTEFAINHSDQWAYKRGIELDFIAPVRLAENKIIENSSGKLRDECLDMHWFESLGEARRLIEGWRVEYNETQPRSSLGDRAPEACAAELLGVGTSL